MSGIEVSREKIEVLRSFPPVDGGSPRRTKVTIPCNRMLLPLRNKRTNEKIAIRGKSLTGVLRMAMALIACYRERGTVADEGSDRTFAQSWSESLSILDTRFMPGNWIAVYCNGSRIFSTAEGRDLDLIERIARGGALREDMLDRHADHFKNANETVEFRYDSQLAVVVNDQENQVKCSILERSISSEGTLSFTFPKEKRHTITQAMDLAINIIESSSLHNQYTIMNNQAKSLRGDDQRKMRTLQEMQKKRVNQLHQAVSVVVKSHSIQFWPEEPRFLIN